MAKKQKRLQTGFPLAAAFLWQVWLILSKGCLPGILLILPRCQQ
jgi:hypothetical protein